MIKMKMMRSWEKTINVLGAFNAAKVVAVFNINERFEGLGQLMYEDTLLLNDVGITISTKLLLIIRAIINRNLCRKL